MKRDWTDFAREIDFYIDKICAAHKELVGVRGPYPEGWREAVGSLEEAIEALKNLKSAERSEEEADEAFHSDMAATIQRLRAKFEEDGRET